MPTLSIPKSYAAGSVLTKSHLDDIESAVETYLNITQIGYENIDISTTLSNLSQSQAETILTAGGYSTLTTTTLGADTSITTTAANYNSVTSVAAGVYLVCATAIVELSQTGLAESTNQAILNIDLYNVTSSAYINPSFANTSLRVGCVKIFNGVSIDKKQSVSWVYPVTVTSTSEIAFRASISTTSTATATLKQNSVIQLFRIRSS